jgi:hypothetical protein
MQISPLATQSARACGGQYGLAEPFRDERHAVEPRLCLVHLLEQGLDLLDDAMLSVRTSSAGLRIKIIAGRAAS